ncbi:condensation domain-containing protein [Streptomyces qinglanensis]|uniref:condensation domain-containing protein n=1 Tax=Streptomyces qinglanensis TaxID=943816 RepID=UPI0037996A7A
MDGTGSGLSAAGKELLSRRLTPRAAAGSSGTGPDTARPAPAEPGGPAPLAPAQHRLWFIDRLTRGSVAYNVSAAYRLTGPLDTAALTEALAYVVQRHEVLRSQVTVTEQGDPRLRAAFTAADIPPAVHDVTASPDPVAEAHRLTEHYADTRFELERGPLLRLWLAELGERDHVLGLVVHHILFDRDSLDIFSRELSAAYRAAAGGAAPDLVPLAAQYADFAREQARATGGPGLDGRAEVWKARLGGVPPVLELPADHERPGRPSYRAGQVPVHVPPEVAGRLRELGQEHGATAFVVFLAAFQGLLGRLAAQEALLVGCPFNGRSRVAEEGLIGFFVNSLPIVGELRGDPCFTTLLDRTREHVLAAHDDQHVPFDRIVGAVDPPRDLSRNPLVQVWFDLADGGPGGTAPPLSLPGVRSSYFGEGRPRTRFDAELHLGTAPDGAVTGRLLYARDLFGHQTAESFAGYYTHFLAEVARRPAARLSQVPVMSADQVHTLLEDWAVAGE